MGAVSAKALRSADPDELDPDDAPAASAAWEDEALPSQLKTIRILANYKPHAKGRQFHGLREWLRKRYRIAVAGRRGGKTTAGGAESATSVCEDFAFKRLGKANFSHRYPGGAPRWRPVGKNPRAFLEYWMVAPTYFLGDEQRIALQDAFGIAKKGGMIVSQTGNTWWLRGGIRIDFKSAQRPENLVSKGLAGLWYDEAARGPARLWHDDLQPVLTDSLGWALVTTTPLGRNWVWSELACKGDPREAAILAEDQGLTVKDILDPAYGFVRWTTADNTALPHLKEEMEKMRSRMPEPMFRRNYLAGFTAFIGQCFPFLTPDRHLLRIPWLKSSFRRIVAGVDWGWDHPGAIAVWGQDYKRGHWHELETVARRETVVDGDDLWRTQTAECWTVIAQYLRQKWGVQTFYLPHDEPASTKAFRRRGLPIRPAYTKPGSRRAGMVWLQMALFNGEADFSTPGTYREFEALRHPEIGNPDHKELWLKVKDDRFDASRYALSDAIENGTLNATRGNSANVLTSRR